MNIRTINNQGNQYYQENNFYNSNSKQFTAEACVESVEKVGKLSITIIAVIMGIVADFIGILSGVLQLKKDGFSSILNTSYLRKINVYIIVLGLLFLFLFIVSNFILTLIRYKSKGKYILKGNSIYKLRLAKCPICGNSCNGKLKIVVDEHGTFYCCHRDKLHKWRVEYNEIMKMIK